LPFPLLGSKKGVLLGKGSSPRDFQREKRGPLPVPFMAPKRSSFLCTLAEWAFPLWLFGGEPPTQISASVGRDFLPGPPPPHELLQFTYKNLGPLLVRPLSRRLKGSPSHSPGVAFFLYFLPPLFVSARSPGCHMRGSVCPPPLSTPMLLGETFPALHSQVVVTLRGGFPEKLPCSRLLFPSVFRFSGWWGGPDFFFR